METNFKWYKEVKQVLTTDSQRVKIIEVSNKEETGYIITANGQIVIDVAFETIQEAENWKKNNKLGIIANLVLTGVEKLYKVERRKLDEIQRLSNSNS